MGYKSRIAAFLAMTKLLFVLGDYSVAHSEKINGISDEMLPVIYEIAKDKNEATVKLQDGRRVRGYLSNIQTERGEVEFLFFPDSGYVLRTTKLGRNCEEIRGPEDNRLPQKLYQRKCGHVFIERADKGEIDGVPEEIVQDLSLCFPQENKIRWLLEDDEPQKLPPENEYSVILGQVKNMLNKRNQSGH